MSPKRVSLLLFVLILISFVPTTTHAAPVFADLNFKELWDFSDRAVEEIPNTGRGYTWGPKGSSGLYENYFEAPNGRRLVQYFDKSRMELGSDGLVTNGLLTKELVSGQRQDGNAFFTRLAPSTIQVAGDDNAGGANVNAPTYASFRNVISLNPGQNVASRRVGQIANLAILKNGDVFTLDQSSPNIKYAAYDPTLGHNVPNVFLDFQGLQGQVWVGNRYLPGPVYTNNPIANVFGLPVTEAYWILAKVGGVEKIVLVQLFERRVLTYTPDNPPAFQVEMGNIGQHYYKWRYGATSTPPPPTTPPPPVNNSATCTNVKPPVQAALTINAALDYADISEGWQGLCVAANKNGQPLRGAKVTFVANYYKTVSYFDGFDTGATGISYTQFNVGHPTIGFTVRVDITVTYNGETAKTSVTWTPR